jgi:hypothetical protein
MLIKRKQLTKAEIEARRRNARKSTGPRTRQGKARSRLNALKHGASTQARSFYASMLDLGEDPEGFRHLLKSLMAARPPADAVEMMLIEDLAVLEWKKARLDRAQAGMQACSLRRLLAERRHRALEVGRDAPNISEVQAVEDGLRRVANSPSKFEEILFDLEVLAQWVKENDLPPTAEDLLYTLYGEQPSPRGSQMTHLVQQLTSPPGAAQEGNALRKALLRVVNLEIRDVTEEYHLYLEEHVELPRAEREATLAPTPAEWHVMIRHENALNRTIEQKLRLLEAIRERRQSRQGAPWQPAGESGQAQPLRDVI